MKLKEIKTVIPSQKVNMGGNLLDQPLPSHGMDQVDPFLLIHHWDNRLPGKQHPRDVGVGPHPHRGFSPVTFVFKGELQHRDSLGNHASVSSGGTQWMFAGSGITHSERMGDDLVENGGDIEFIQFWVNTPAKYKMKAPYYRPISIDETPMIETDKSKVWVVSGDYKGTIGPAPTYSPQLLLRGEIMKTGKLTIPVPENYNTILYLLDGTLLVNGKEVNNKDMVVFENIGQNIAIEAIKNTRYILLSGEPIKEPVASYGPFVMTNQTEIMQAVRDAQMGKMGVLIEEF